VRAPHETKLEAHRVCRRGDATKIRVGMSNAAVGVVAGLPRLPPTGLRCWASTTRRICFTAGRVSRIQYVTHG
jgi:hypothetical protein